MKILLSLAITSVVVLAITLGSAFAQGNSRGRTVICHIPPGNPAAAHTKTVGTPAVAAHLRHGDTLGPCPVSYPY